MPHKTKSKLQSKYTRITLITLATLGVLSLISYLIYLGFTRSGIRATIANDYQYIYTDRDFKMGKAYFNNTKTKLPGISIQDKDVQIQISYQPPSTHANYQTQTTDDQTITYLNVAPDTNLRYIIDSSSSIKEEIELIKRPAPETDLKYQFQIRLTNLKIQKDDQGNILPVFISKNNHQYTLPPLYMYDQNHIESHDVYLQLTQDNPNNESLLTATITPDPIWLQDPNLQYPIIIDPSIVKGSLPNAYLKFDENQGTLAHDSTSNANNANLEYSGATTNTIRQEINIIDQIVTTSGDHPAIVQLDTTKYNGTVTYYFEVVGQVASGTLTAALERINTSTQDATVTITETSPTRKRSTAFTPPAGQTEYNLNLSGGTSPSVKSAKIIVIQSNVGITSTQSQIEIGNHETNKTNTTDSALTSPKYWTYTSTNWNPTPEFYAEVTYQKTDNTYSTAPTYQAAGTAVTGTGAVSPAWPTHQTDDIGIMVVETSGNESINTVPTGWAHVTGSPVTDVASTAGSKLTILWKRAASSSESTLSIGDSGDHQTARIFTFRGVITTGNPWDVVTTNTKTTASTTSTLPAVTTTVANTLVALIAGRPDDAASTTHFGSWTNGNLGSLTERGESGSTSGNGGGFVLTTGTKTTAGSTGTTTATKTVSTTDTYMTLALKGVPDTTPSVTIKLQEDDGSFAGWTDKVTIVNASTSSTLSRIRSSSFTPTSGRHYRIVSSISSTNSSYDIYNAKIIANQSTSISKLESQYLLLNTQDSGSTGLQNYPILWDASAWVGVNNVYKYAQDATNSSDGSKLQDITNGNADITNATVTGANQQISSPFLMPNSGNQLDANVTNTTGVVTAGRIITEAQLQTLNISTQPTWKNSSYCISESCLYFNGIDNVTTITNASSIDFNDSLAIGFTISTWIKPNSLGENSTGHIIDKGPNTYASISAGSSSNLANLNISLDLATTDATLTITDAITLNNWHHISIGYTDDGDDEISVYIDGVLRGTSTNGSGTPATDTYDLTIGGISANNFHGYIDELKIYPEEHTRSQVQLNHLQGSQYGSAVLFGTQSQRYLSDGLIAYWPLDQTSGNPTDASGNGYTLTNYGTTAYVTGKYNHGSEHAPASSQYLSTTSLTLPIHTLSFWTNPDALTNYYFNLSSSANVQSNSSGVLSANGFTNPQIYVNGVKSDTIIANQWQHITVTSDTPITADDFNIGKINTNYFDGTMDEVRLYNQVLTPNQIGLLANWAPSPVAYWPIDQNTGQSTLIDASGNGNTGTLSINLSPPEWTKGQLGSAINFRGGNEYVSIPDSSSLSITSDLTISAWIKPKNVTPSTTFNIVGKWDSTTQSYGLAQYGDEIRLYIGSINNYATTNSANLLADNWYHVTGQYIASTQTITIFINGVNQPTTTTGTIPSSITDNANNTYIAAQYGSGGTSSLDLTISASSDDAFKNENAYNDTSTAMHFGGVSPSPLTDYGQGFRFNNVTIPNGATITNAYLTLVKYTNEWNGIELRLTAIDEDNTATFSSGSPPGSRNITSSYITSEYLDQNKTDGTSYSYPVDTGQRDIFADAISTVVNRTGWSSGNSLGIVSCSDQDPGATTDNCLSYARAIYRTYDYGTPATNAPKLHIEYTSPAGPENPFIGILDDIKIYNYARSSTQIVEDMNGSHPVGGSPIGSQTAYWKLDENSSTTLHDSSPNNNNLTLQTGTWTSDAKFNSGIDFESSSSNYATIADNASLSITGSLSLSAWIKPESISAGTSFPIVAKGSSYALIQYGDELRMNIGSTSNYKTTNSVNLQTDTWYHVLGVYDSTTQTVSLYINGREYPGTVTGTIPSSISDGASNFDIGRLYTGSSYQFTISTNADDGIQPQTVGWLNNQDYDGFGYYNGVYNNTHAGLRFQNITIPQGTTVSNAYISVYGNTTNSAGSATNIDVNIIGDDVDNASSWADGSSIPSGTGMTDTSAVVAWNPSSWSNEWINTPSITSIVQEILDRGGWNSGNNMRFAIRNDTTTGANVMAFEDTNLGNGRQAILNITTGNSPAYYDGIIDEIKIYSSALTASQALIEYNRGKINTMGSASTNSSNVPQNNQNWTYCPPGSAASCTGPIHEYMMDENTGTTVYDTGSAATKYNGTLTLGPSFSPGKFGSGIVFDGVDSYISVGANELYQETDAFTISTWLNPKTLSNNPQLVCNVVDDNTCFEIDSTGWAGVTNGLVYCSNNSCTTIGKSINNVITTNVWQHVVMTYNGSNTCQFYVNGINVTSNSTCSETAGSYDTTIGGVTSGPNALNGSMDLVRTYDYVRTPAQIAWEYNRGAPVAWYRMDECSGTTIHDASGHNLTGTLTNAASPGTCTTSGSWYNGAAGVINSSIDLDGTDDMVTVADPSNASLDFNDSDFAISGWFNRDTFTTDDVIVAKRNGDAAGDVGYLVYIDDATDKLVFEVSDGTDEYSLTSTSTFTSTGWNHFTVVWDDDSAAGSEIYINGKPDLATDSGTIGNIGDLSNSNPLRMGDVSDGTSTLTTHFFDGKLDDIRIFNYAPTTQQIRDAYNNGAVSFK